MSLIVLLAEYWIRIKPQITPGNTECHCRFLLYHKDVAYVLHSNFRPFFLLEIRNWVCQYSGSPYTVSSFLGWSFCFPQDNFCPVALDVNKKRNKTKKKHISDFVYLLIMLYSFFLCRLGRLGHFDMILSKKKNMKPCCFKATQAQGSKLKTAKDDNVT